MAVRYRRMAQRSFLFQGGEFHGQQKPVPVGADGRPQQLTTVEVSPGLREVYARTVSGDSFGYRFRNRERHTGSSWVIQPAEPPAKKATKKATKSRAATGGRKR